MGPPSTSILLEDDFFFSPKSPGTGVSQIHVPSGDFKENPGAIMRLAGRAGAGTLQWLLSIVSTEITGVEPQNLNITIYFF